MNRHMRGAVLTVTAIALFAIGCNLVVGRYDFRDDGDGGPKAIADADGGAESDSASCTVDLAETCFPCDPTTNAEFLNACGESPCIPFDRSRLDGLLLPDGGLPQLPPDGGTTQ